MLISAGRVERDGHEIADNITKDPLICNRSGAANAGTLRMLAAPDAGAVMQVSHDVLIAGEIALEDLPDPGC